jgi:hypothetical protein
MSETIVNPGTRKINAGLIREKLTMLRQDYDDNIPGEVVCSYSKTNKVKVRTGWFTPLIFWLETCMDQGEITNPETIKTVNDFINQYTGKITKKQKMNSQEDIDRGNQTIDLVLSQLKQ